MSQVISMRLSRIERSRLEKRAELEGETLGRYCKALVERGAEVDGAIHAIRAEARASAERSERLIAEQAKAMQGLIDTLNAALAPQA